jgi:undecaprenyl-diphosphatase
VTPTTAVEKQRSWLISIISTIESKILIGIMFFSMLFWALSWLVGSSDTVAGFDKMVMGAIYEHVDAEPFGSHLLGDTARDITSLGGVTLIVLSTILGMLWVAGHRDRAGAIFLMSVVVGGTILMIVLKEVFERDRPDVAASYLDVTSYSYPSGHSMLSAFYPAIAIVFLRQEEIPRLHRLYLFVAIGLSILIGISRVILGAHYPTDVLAGWAVGFGWVGICRAILGFLEKDNEQIELEEAKPENVEVKV